MTGPAPCKGKKEPPLAAARTTWGVAGAQTARAALVAATLALALCVARAHAALQLVGDVQAVAPLPQGVTLALSSGAVAEAQFVEAGVLRVRLTPPGAAPTPARSLLRAPADPPPPAVERFDDPAGGATWLVTSTLKAQLLHEPFRVVVFDSAGALLFADSAYAFDNATGVVFRARHAPADEANFGLGLRGGPLNRKGRAFFFRNTDTAAWTATTDPLYQSHTFLLSMRNSRAAAELLDTEANAFFDVDAQGQGLVVMGAEAGPLQWFAIAGPAPADVSRRLALLTGFAPLPPLWALGYHHSRFGWASAAEILAIAQAFRDFGFPADAIWLDIPYMDRLRKSTWSPAGFPDPVSFHAALDALDFRKVYITEPCVVRDDPLWGFLDAAGLFVQDASGASIVTPIFLGDVSWIDFSRQAARDWTREQLKVWLSFGIDGVWNDLNEPAAAAIPGARFDFDGAPRSERASRNVYATLENETTRRAMLELRPNTRPFILSRAGAVGVQRSAFTWSGDSLSTFEALRVSVQMTLSMGLSGQSFFGHDVGGFLGSPDGELYLRWLEFARWTPFLRTHSIITAAPREPWSFPQPFVDMIRRELERRYEWLPYLYTLAAATASAAQPMAAPALYYFPQDQALQDQDDAFMVGPDLLVAPVLERGAVTRSVRLPAGVRWTHLQSDAVFEGGAVAVVDAPLGQAPVFVREGAVVVRGPVRQHTRDAVPPDRFVDIFSGVEGELTLYEDDGETFAYREGAFRRTRISHERVADAWRVRIERMEDGYDPGPRFWTIRLHRVLAPPLTVLLDGAPLVQAPTPAALQAMGQGWLYDPASGRLIVRFQDQPAPLQLQIGL